MHGGGLNHDRFARDRNVLFTMIIGMVRMAAIACIGLINFQPN